MDVKQMHTKQLMQTVGVTKCLLNLIEQGLFFDEPEVGTLKSQLEEAVLELQYRRTSP